LRASDCLLRLHWVRSTHIIEGNLVVEEALYGWSEH
jgi:hypothetical protein